jgi:peptidoglycan/xylan/chitin deacetylase (PgdA/CDA1 family)
MVDRDRRAYDPAMTARLRAAVPGSVRRAVWQAISPALRGISSVKGTTTEEPVVALTFDDGPDPETTPAVLELLARAGARATFFMLVDRAEAHPELVSETVGAGHEVGLHGLDHTRLTTLPPTEVYGRLRDGRDRLSRLVGAPIRLFRAPHGAQRVATVAAARAARLRPVTWTLDAEDWADNTTEEVAARVGTHAPPGSIVVLHDSLVVTASDAPPPRYSREDVVAAVLTRLSECGLSSVTVSTLLRSGRVRRGVWLRD